MNIFEQQDMQGRGPNPLRVLNNYERFRNAAIALRQSGYTKPSLIDTLDMIFKETPLSKEEVT